MIDHKISEEWRRGIRGALLELLTEEIGLSPSEDQLAEALMLGLDAAGNEAAPADLAGRERTAIDGRFKVQRIHSTNEYILSLSAEAEDLIARALCLVKQIVRPDEVWTRMRVEMDTIDDLASEFQARS